MTKHEGEDHEVKLVAHYPGTGKKRRWTAAKVFLVFLAIFILGTVVRVAEADAHGWRHGKGMSAAQVRTHPSWLKAPGYSCYHEDWGTTKGDLVVIPDEELGWLIIWKCVCVEDPDIADDWDCHWKIIRIVPDNTSNARILEILHYLAHGRSYERPKLVILAAGYVFRKHSATDDCHWHNPKNQPAIRMRRL